MGDAIHGIQILFDTVEITASINAATTVTGASKIDSARTDGFRISRTEWFAAFQPSGEETAIDGALMLGFTAHGTATQITEVIGADPQSSSDADENADTMKLKLMPLAIFGANLIDSDTNGQTNVVSATDKGVMTQPGSTSQDVTAQWFVHTLCAFAVAPKVCIFAKHYGVWLR